MLNRRQFHQRLRKNVLILPGAFDCLSALLVQKAGFEAVYLSGAGLTVSYLGKPDIGLLTMDEVGGTARRLAVVVNIPLLVDADTGFGGVANIRRLVQELEAAGAAGVQIEDQAFPKRCGHLTGKTLIPAHEMVQKIKAAIAARKDPHFLIIARTDARGVKGVKDALARAHAYKKAGADIIFPEALESRAEFALFGKEKRLGVLMANMTEFGRSPALAVSDLAHLGFRVVLYPMTAFRTAAFAMDEALAALKKAGDSRSLVGRMQTRRELYDLIRYGDYDQREKIYIKEAKI